MYLTLAGEQHTNKLPGVDYYPFSSDLLTQDQLKYGIFTGSETDPSQIAVDTVKRDADIAQLDTDAIDSKRKELLIELRIKIDSEINAITSMYPEAVKLSFSAKADEAEKLISGTITDPTLTPIIYAESQTKFTTTTPTLAQCLTVANRIKANSDAYKAIIGKASEINNRYYTEIMALVDPRAYSLPAVLLK